MATHPLALVTSMLRFDHVLFWFVVLLSSKMKLYENSLYILITLMFPVLKRQHFFPYRVNVGNSPNLRSGMLESGTNSQNTKLGRKSVIANVCL